MNCLLQTLGLSFSYGSQPVLCEVNLLVGQGEMMGIVGPNGSGKTTLLRILSGSLRPHAGEVRVMGQNLGEFSPKDRAKAVAVVSQSPTVPEGFTALEVVLMGRNPHLGVLQWEGRNDVEVALRIMELTDTTRFANRFLSSLSGGERQRVFIARALAQEAPLLLLDEPTANLDIGYQTGILDMLQAIRGEAKVTVIAAMHDLTLAAQYCDHMAVLHQGTIAAVGRPEEVLTPDLLSQAFGVDVSVIRHPLDQTPIVLPRRKTTLEPDAEPRAFAGDGDSLGATPTKG